MTTTAHMTDNQATCPCPSCRHYEAVNALVATGLSTTPKLGILTWTGVLESHLDLGLWSIGAKGDDTYDAMSDRYVGGLDVVSFTPCSLIEDEALVRFLRQQDAEGLGTTTSDALAVFLAHVEVMNP